VIARRQVSLLVIQVVTFVLACFVVIPFVMMILSSLKNVRESALFNLALPTEWMWSNYATVLSRSNVLSGFANSFIVTSFTLVLTNISAAMAAFVIQRRADRMTKTVFILLFLGLIVPVAIIPTIKLMMDLSIHNTYFGIVLFYTASVMPFSVFVLVGFMKSVPRELDESALIDGSSYLRLFVQIIMPLVMPALITVTIVVTVNVWNDFFAQFYLISDSRKWTIVLRIYSFMSMYSTNWGLVFAFMVLVMSPVLIVYFALQRYIIDGLTAGSVKG